MSSIETSFGAVEVVWGQLISTITFNAFVCPKQNKTKT
jgi:hypothetical protein